MLIAMRVSVVCLLAAIGLLAQGLTSASLLANDLLVRNDGGTTNIDAVSGVDQLAFDMGGSVPRTVLAAVLSAVTGPRSENFAAVGAIGARQAFCVNGLLGF